MQLLMAFALLAPPYLDGCHTVTPSASFLHTAEDEVVTVTLSAGPAAAAQARLDAARNASPDACLSILLRGRVEVTDQPLRIGSRTVVQFADGAEVVAGRGDVPALLAITGSEFVTLRSVGTEPATLRGGATAIRVTDSERVHIDRLAIRGSGTGVSFKGRGATGYARGFSATRMLIRDCRAGIEVDETAQFQCHDSTVVAREAALRIASPDAMFVNNRIVGDVRLSAALNVVARNDVRGMLTLTGESSRAYVVENELAGGLGVDGEWHALYRNTLRGDVVVAGEEHTFCQNAGAALPASPAAVVFNPPTAARWHEEPVLPGTARYDIEVQGTAVWTFPRWEAIPEDKRPPLADLSVAQQAVDAAVSEHPDAAVVVRLKGLFQATAEWVLPRNVCVVLDGSIRAAGDQLDHRLAEDGRRSQLIGFPKGGCASFSGGIVDAAFLPYHALNMPGAARIVVDGVTVKRSGFNGITTKEHNNARRPVFIRGCTVVDCAGRGIWVHVCKNVHVLDCVSSGNISDGIDYDAYGHETTGLFNVCSGNRRHGMFIEEAVKHVRVFGNQLDGNGSCGVAIWDEAVVGNTGWNSVIANTCRGNGTGVSIGGRAAEKTSNENLVLGNVLRGNRKIGLRYANAHSYGNYCVHNQIADNADDLVDHSRRVMTEFWSGIVQTRD